MQNKTVMIFKSIGLAAIGYVGAALLLVALQRTNRNPVQVAAEQIPAHPIRKFFYAHGSWHACLSFPSASDTTMLLFTAPENFAGGQQALPRDLHEFASYLSTDGVNQVVLPDPPPRTYQEIQTWIEILRAQQPDEPLLIGTITRENELQLGFAGNYFGREGDAPAFHTAAMRDGTALAYRHFPADSNTVVILMHGAGSQSTPYTPLAQFLSGHDLAQVYTPNLRGHYLSGARRGDVAYADQLTDDLADLIGHIKQRTPDARIVLAGQSWGGGLVIRFAGGRYASLVEACLLISPYPGPALNVFRRAGDGGWAQCLVPRVVGLTMLNLIGLRALNHLPVLRLYLPPAVADEMSTTSYTYRAFLAMSPHWMYWRDLQRIRQPLLVLLGAQDGVFDDTRLGALMRQHTSAEVHVIPQATHMGIMFNKQTYAHIRDWLRALKNRPESARKM